MPAPNDTPDADPIEDAADQIEPADEILAGDPVPELSLADRHAAACASVASRALKWAEQCLASPKQQNIITAAEMLRISAEFGAKG